MTPALAMAFYEHVKAQPCVRCKSFGCEAAHIQVVKSKKTGLTLPRSHRTAARWGVVPLCPDCHRIAPDSIHASGEDAFFRGMGWSRQRVFQEVVSVIAYFCEDQAGAR